MRMTREELLRIIADEIIRMKTEEKRNTEIAPEPRFRAEPALEKALPCKQASDQIRAAREESLEILKSSTAARVGIGRCGPRLTTDEMLKFRADHAAARDSVQKDVDPEFLKGLGLTSVVTQCRDKNEYLTRPDLGRKLTEESKATLKKICKMSPQVQIFAGGGLSSVAIRANLETILPVMEDALKAKGIETGTPFYVKYARVGVEDEICELLDAEVVCVLIGERPGLMTAESMSAYIAYRAKPGVPESIRTVVSNIHKGGTAAAEAGAYIADIIEQILEAKASGVNLKR
ncbi:MAG: ethanolamine ammonia-lyase subunit EutC [Lachnospiraceae bacterium]|nr:ethanolamine ammonia-lyase subunit EutC [Lachnospiraceae bacterium]